MSRRETGRLREGLALRYLIGKGYEVPERNYRTRHGEIDLILRDGETLVFVLVCKAVGQCAANLQRAVEMDHDLEPEHLVNLVPLEVRVSRAAGVMAA